MLASEVLCNPAVVLLVRELNVLEQEASHGELELVSLHHLLLNLMAKLGQRILTLGSRLIHISMPESALFSSAGCKRGRGAARKHRLFIVLASCMALNPTNVLPSELC